MKLTMPGPSTPCRNLIALAFLVKFQKHLSLRVLVLQPLVITFIMLGSTAALVSDCATIKQRHGLWLHGPAIPSTDGMTWAV